MRIVLDIISCPQGVQDDVQPQMDTDIKDAHIIGNTPVWQSVGCFRKTKALEQSKFPVQCIVCSQLHTEDATCMLTRAPPTVSSIVPLQTGLEFSVYARVSIVLDDAERTQHI